MYGDLEQFMYEETATRYQCLDRPNDFDEAVNLDFACIYGLKTVVFRHSSMCWQPLVTKEIGIRKMIEWVNE